MYRVPKSNLELYIEVKCHSYDGDRPINEEEREMLTCEIHDRCFTKDYPVETPWQIPTSQDIYELIPKSILKAFVTDYDGKAFIISTAIHRSLVDELTRVNSGNIDIDTDDYDDEESEIWCKLRLEPDGEVVTGTRILRGMAIYDILLHISWHSNQIPQSITLEEALTQLESSSNKWQGMGDTHKVFVSLAHGPLQAEEYKTYDAKDFPALFFDDLRLDPETTKDISLIIVRTKYSERVEHEYSDDYQDAARAHGEDCSPWYSTEWHEIEPYFELEIS